MFTLRQALLSAALCMALTSPSQASAPDESVATNSTSLATPAAPFVWDPYVTKAAKEENERHPLMSLTIWPLQQICQILAENGDADTIATLGQVSIHMAGRILRKMGEYDNPTIRQAIRVDLQNSIRRVREKALVKIQKELEDQSEDQSEVAVLEPWEDLLGENASLQHLIWARQMLRPDNVERLNQKSLWEALTRMKNKTKALALGACASELFTEGMGWVSQEKLIIKAANWSSRRPSEYPALGAACKHLFTEQMDDLNHAYIIAAALKSSRPLSEYDALAVACKHLFTKQMVGNEQVEIIRVLLESPQSPPECLARGIAAQALFTDSMGGYSQTVIFEAVFPLSDIEIAQLAQECETRPQENDQDRRGFILERVRAFWTDL